MATVWEYEPIDINFREEQSLGVDLTCHQLDEVILNFNVWNGSEKEDMTSSDYNVEFRVHKPDNTDYIQGKVNIVKGNGTLKITCTEQLTAASGICKGELRVFNVTKKQRTSRIFHIRVIPSVVEVDRSVSQSTISVLQELKAALDYAYILVELLKELEEQIKKGQALLTDLKPVITSAEAALKNLKAELVKVDTQLPLLQAENKKAEGFIAQAKEESKKLENLITTAGNLGSVIIGENLPNVAERKEKNLYIKLEANNYKVSGITFP